MSIWFFFHFALSLLQVPFRWTGFQRTRSTWMWSSAATQRMRHERPGRRQIPQYHRRARRVHQMRTDWHRNQRRWVTFVYCSLTYGRSLTFPCFCLTATTWIAGLVQLRRAATGAVSSGDERAVGQIPRPRNRNDHHENRTVSANNSVRIIIPVMNVKELTNSVILNI